MKFWKVFGIILNKFSHQCVAMQNPGSHLGNPKFLVILSSQLSLFPAGLKIGSQKHHVPYSHFHFHYHYNYRGEKPTISLSLSLQSEKSQLFHFHYREKSQEVKGDLWKVSTISKHSLVRDATQENIFGQRRNSGKHLQELLQKHFQDTEQGFIQNIPPL